MTNARQPDFLTSLSAIDRERLLQAGRTTKWADGDVLMRQGGAPDAMFVVEDGLATVTVTTRDGRTVLLALLGPGDTAGEFGVLDGRPRSATVTARGAVQALRIDATAVTDVLRRAPETSLALLRVLTARLRRSDLARAELVTASTEVRVARRLIELAADHGELTDGRITIGLGLTQSELAAWVGASREGVSDALRSFRQAGIVETGRRSVVITDLSELRDRALS